jgi:type I restriction enzyme, S subunit
VSLDAQVARVALSKLSEVITKGTTPRTLGHSYANEGTPFLRAENIQDLSVKWLGDVLFIDKETDALLARSRIRPGDVLVSIAGTIGRIGVVPMDAPAMNCNQAVAIVRPSSKVERRYLAHWLASEDAQRRIGRAQVTATISNLSLHQLGALEVPLPPLPEQRRIADILDKADAVRRKRNEAIALTEELLRSAFLEMFGDPVTNPKGWPVTALGDTFATDPRIGTLRPASDSGSQAVVRVGELGGYDVALARCKRVALVGDELDRFRLVHGDVVLARAIGSEDHLGKASVFQSVGDDVVFDSHVMRLRFSPRVLRPQFFAQWLRSEGGRRRFMREAGRTAVQFNVNGTQIARVLLPLPPLSEQDRFISFFSAAREIMNRQTTSLAESDALFATLTQRAFRGDLTPRAESAAARVFRGSRSPSDTPPALP